MEHWFEAGPLSQAEFHQLIKLVARYVHWDVDQFDRWAMPGPAVTCYIDFSQHPTRTYPEDSYRPVWPTADDGEPAWTVWRQDDNGVRAQVARFGNPKAADAHVAALERGGHKQSYWVVPPTA